MANIRLDLPYEIFDGTPVSFYAPCDSSDVGNLIINYPSNGEIKSHIFLLKDAHDRGLMFIDNIFTSGACVKVILNITKSAAYIQNANSNNYIEEKFKNLDLLKVDTEAPILPTNERCMGVVCGRENFVVAAESEAYYSSDGKTWKKCIFKNATTIDLHHIAFNKSNNVFIVCDYTQPGKYWRSTNGATWTLMENFYSGTDTYNIYNISVANDKFFITCGASNKIFYSTDAITWTAIECVYDRYDKVAYNSTENRYYFNMGDEIGYASSLTETWGYDYMTDFFERKGRTSCLVYDKISGEMRTLGVDAVGGYLSVLKFSANDMNSIESSPLPLWSYIDEGITMTPNIKDVNLSSISLDGDSETLVIVDPYSGYISFYYGNVWDIAPLSINTPRFIACSSDSRKVLIVSEYCNQAVIYDFIHYYGSYTDFNGHDVTYVNKATKIVDNEGNDCTSLVKEVLNVVESPPNLGIGYGICSTSITSQDKTVEIPGYKLIPNNLVAVFFTNAIKTSNTTLNISDTGAKPIYYLDRPITADMIRTRDTAIFTFDGSIYRLLSTDGWMDRSETWSFTLADGTTVEKRVVLF